MIHILLVGCHGRMGQQVSNLCRQSVDMVISAGVSRHAGQSDGYPVFCDWSVCHTYADVVMDFSAVDGLDLLLAYCMRHSLPVLLAVTGYSPRQLEQIKNAARTIPIFRSPNLSIGANTLLKLAKQGAELLGDSYDIVITEHHHRGKIDRPSGTALLLSSAVGKRGEIHSLRSGTVPGEHSVIFSGQNEIIELIHRTFSREVYARGALAAARFLASVRKPGLYGMDDLL